MNEASGSERARTTLAYLKRRIGSGEWPVGSRIPTEPELMELLGVGKTTVREGVRSLASLGMLETLPGRGTFVRSRTPVSGVLTDFLSDYDVADILVYRRALEIEAAQRAAAHRTPTQLEALRAALDREPAALDVDYVPRIEKGRSPGQFHFLMIEASGSRLMTSLYAGVMAVLREAMARGDVAYGEDENIRREDHRALFAAIAAGDGEAAAYAAATHVDRDLVPAEADVPVPSDAPAEVPAEAPAEAEATGPTPAGIAAD